MARRALGAASGTGRGGLKKPEAGAGSVFAAGPVSLAPLSFHELVGQDSHMRFDLRLHGRTEDGKRCMADVSVYANSADSLKYEAHEAAKNAPWHIDDEAATWVRDNSTIVVERVELLNKNMGQ